MPCLSEQHRSSRKPCTSSLTTAFPASSAEAWQGFRERSENPEATNVSNSPRRETALLQALPQAQRQLRPRLQFNSWHRFKKVNKNIPKHQSRLKSPPKRVRFKPVFLNKLKNNWISLVLFHKTPHLGVVLLSPGGFLVKHAENKWPQATGRQRLKVGAPWLVRLSGLSAGLRTKGSPP